MIAEPTISSANDDILQSVPERLLIEHNNQREFMNKDAEGKETHLDKIAISDGERDHYGSLSVYSISDADRERAMKVNLIGRERSARKLHTLHLGHPRPLWLPEAEVRKEDRECENVETSSPLPSFSSSPVKSGPNHDRNLLFVTSTPLNNIPSSSLDLDCDLSNEGGVPNNMQPKFRCIHFKAKSACLECFPDLTCSKIPCPHGKRKYYCMACGGGGMCQHSRRRGTCRICNHTESEVRSYIRKKDLAPSSQAETQVHPVSTSNLLNENGSTAASRAAAMAAEIHNIKGVVDITRSLTVNNGSTKANGTALPALLAPLMSMNIDSHSVGSLPAIYFFEKFNSERLYTNSEHRYAPNRYDYYRSKPFTEAQQSISGIHDEQVRKESQNKRYHDWLENSHNKAAKIERSSKHESSCNCHASSLGKEKPGIPPLIDYRLYTNSGSSYYNQHQAHKEQNVYQPQQHHYAQQYHYDAPSSSQYQSSSTRTVTSPYESTQSHPTTGLSQYTKNEINNHPYSYNQEARQSYPSW